MKHFQKIHQTIHRGFAIALLGIAVLWGGCLTDDVAPSTLVERVGVEDFVSDEGYTALVWLQGNSSAAIGAVACWEDNCAIADERGVAAVAGLPEGEVVIEVQTAQGVPLLIPLTLNNHWVPHLAARSLTPNIYADWMNVNAWPQGTGLVDIWLDDATEDGAPLIPNVRLTASAGDIWSVHDLSYALQEDISSGTGPMWVANVPPGEVELTLTAEDALCSARSMGWRVTSEDNTITMTVPTKADHSTSIYVQCVPLP